MFKKRFFKTRCTYLKIDKHGTTASLNGSNHRFTKENINCMTNFWFDFVKKVTEKL